MTVEVTFENDDVPGIADEAERLDGFGVDVGVFANDDSFYAMLANVHEYGATIDHPGGTPYIIIEGKGAVFVSNEKAAQLEAKDIPVQYTEPHTITIPERRFLRPTVNEQHQMDQVHDAAVQHLNAILLELADAEGIATVVGKTMVDNARRNMGDYGPPLSENTTRRRGSRSTARPLVDDGILMSKIEWQVTKQ